MSAKRTRRPARGAGTAKGRRPAANSNAKAAGSTGITPRLTTTLIVVAVVAVGAVALVLGLALGGSGHTPAPVISQADAATVIAQATTVPASVSDQIGRGDAQALPKPVSGAPLTAAGKPEMLYIGAEYCPYCATERWAMVIALSRFGTFSGLTLTHSSSTDVFANTPTFTFHGSTFSSPYLAFSPVETTTNQPTSGGGYKPLDTPTAGQTSVWQSLDPSGGIPFVDIAGRYMISGVTYSPNVLQGKAATEIAASLADPTTSIARSAVGAADTIVAAICNTTNQQPAAVCTTPAIHAIQAQLG